MLTLTGVAGTAGQTYSATGTGSLAIPVSLGSSDPEEGNLRLDGGNPVVSFAGLTIAAGQADNNLAMNYSGDFSQAFQSYGCSEGHYQGECLGGGWNDMSVDVTTTMGTSLPISVTGSGQQQGIQIASSAVAVTADGNIASGPCSGGSLQRDILDAYRGAAVPAITTAVSITFPSISVFALKNLLFPATNLVNMSSPVYAPGDLVILGSFAQQS
jgi:hypothetical protein